MLHDIRIRGLGVIEDVALDLSPGLTVVTGETGAGKTMVVTALTLLFGARADAARIRTGDSQCSVEGTLSVPLDGAVADRVREAGGQLDDLSGPAAGDAAPETADGELILRRVVTAAGRSRASVGGAAVPVALLGELSGSLFALHGQSDQMRLAAPAQQLAALDRYAGVDVAAIREAFTRWRRADEAYDQRIARSQDLEREAQLLRHGLEEIEAIAPQPGEDDALAERIRRLSSADELRLAARDAQISLTGDPDDPSGDQLDARTLLARAQRALSADADADPVLLRIAARIADLVSGADDLGAELRDFADDLAADPEGLAAAQERLAAVRGLTRRYGEDLESVLLWAKSSAEQLAQLDTSQEALAALGLERDLAQQALVDLALDASARRGEAAETLGAAITAELRELAMPTAQVRARVSPRGASTSAVTIKGKSVPIGPEGLDHVALELSAHPGAPPAPLQRSASGGELSRVMLAVEVVLAGADPVPTMVFDEIDSGVGGRAATEIGRRLARLARLRQVIVVTHLAQVAAFADTHIVIDKHADADADADSGSAVTRSDVRAVSGLARRSELARMLSGQDTATARRHAGELLHRARAEMS